MEVVMLYREKSEHRQAVLEYVREFERRTSRKIELMEIDTKGGWDLGGLYQITQYPAVIVTSNDGKLQNLWQGEPLPLMDEVVGYALEQ